MTSARTLGIVLVVGVLVLGVPRLFETSTWVLVQAVRDLGPISGWRCAQPGAYTYDPRRARPDSTFLPEPPEEFLRVLAPAAVTERVEADLHGGDAILWTRIGPADTTHPGEASVPEDAGGERRVYVLSPGRLQTITFDLAEDHRTTCVAHLGDWHIVGEHTLQ